METPVNSERFKIRLKEEPHPSLPGKMVQRAYSLDGRKLGYSTDDRKTTVARMTRYGYEIVE